MWDSKDSRRKFLKTSAAATVPLFLPSGVLAASGRAGANGRVGVGIVGMGTRGGQLAETMPADGRIVAACDADFGLAAKQRERLGGDWDVERDYRRMLDRADIDAVVVCPCDHHHVLAAMLACQAGKDVYVEKPISLTIAEGRALVNAARRYGRVAQTGTQQRTMELNRFACEYVRDGKIGEVKVVEALNFNTPVADPGHPSEAVPDGLDWDLWLGPAADRSYNAAYRKGFMKWRDFGGAGMTGLGSHAFDMVQYALGTDDTGPVEIWPVGDGPRARLRYRYANGVEVRLEDRGPRLGAIFVGSDCKMEINRNKFTTNPPDFVTGAPDPAVAVPWDGPGWKAKGHVQNWLDCVRSREKPNADIEIGHRSATICHLLNICRELGRPLRWDPDREVFPGDAEANAKLDRPRRKGWELPEIG
ncbi:MAG: Gfo/Idh/MocA family oxidoreductase [Planctomycetota bacterium]